MFRVALNKKTGEKEKRIEDKRIFAANVAAGIVAGCASFFINSPLYSIIAAVVILGAETYLVKNVLIIKKDAKWWLKKSIAHFIIVWFIVWTILFNTKII